MVGVLSLLLAAAFALAPQQSDVTQTELSIQQAIQSGHLATASHLIDMALERHPLDAGLLNLRGIVHAQRNELREAHTDFAEAARLAPGLTAAWQNLARACQIQADQDTSSNSCAIESWRHVLRLKPDDPEAHASLAQIYEKQERYAESLEESDRLPAGEASRTGNSAVRCADLSALGRTAEAKKIASQLADRGDFTGADFDALGSALDQANCAEVVVVLVEGLDARQVASLGSLRRLATAYEQLQRPAEARKTLERVAVQDPANTYDLLELARLAEAAKDYEGALGYLAHARDLAPGNPQIHFLFAMTAIEMDLPMEARRSLDRALALAPDNPDYNYAMGSVILTTRDAATATRYLRKFVNARPADVKGHYALGIAYFASGDYEKAKQEMVGVNSDPKTAGGAEYFLGRIARLENQLDEAVQHLRKSIEIVPTFSESHTELARVLMLQNDLEGGRAELNLALHLDATSFQANERLLVLYRRTHDPRAKDQAELLKKLDEDRSRRAELMLRSIEVRPFSEEVRPSNEVDRAGALSAQGVADFRDGKFEASAAAFREAAKLAPLKDKDAFTLAMALVKLGDDQGARTLLDDLARKQPDSAIYIYWLGRLDYDQRRYAEALEKLQKAAQLDPRSARIWDSLGLTFDMQGQMEPAREAFEKAVALNRTQAYPSPWPPHDLGYLLLRMDQLKDAEMNLREALRYDSQMPQAHYHLGRVLEKEARNTEAVEEYSQAVALDRTSTDACYSLAMLYRKLHRDAEANAMFSEYRKRKG